MGDKKE